MENTTDAASPLDIPVMPRVLRLAQALEDIQGLSAIDGTTADKAAALLREQYGEVERLRQALRDIADPIAAWQRDLQPGYTLDGGMCVHMANDPETYKRMAREALRE